jgi:hypothetical protein
MCALKILKILFHSSFFPKCLSLGPFRLKVALSLAVVGYFGGPRGCLKRVGLKAGQGGGRGHLRSLGVSRRTSQMPCGACLGRQGAYQAGTRASAK